MLKRFAFTTLSVLAIAALAAPASAEHTCTVVEWGGGVAQVCINNCNDLGPPPTPGATPFEAREIPGGPPAVIFVPVNNAGCVGIITPAGSNAVQVKDLVTGQTVTCQACRT